MNRWQLEDGVRNQNLNRFLTKQNQWKKTVQSTEINLKSCDCPYQWKRWRTMAVMKPVECCWTVDEVFRNKSESQRISCSLASWGWKSHDLLSLMLSCRKTNLFSFLLKGKVLYWLMWFHEEPLTFMEPYLYILNKIINATLFAPIFYELNSKIEDFFYVHKRPISLNLC